MCVFELILKGSRKCLLLLVRVYSIPIQDTHEMSSTISTSIYHIFILHWWLLLQIYRHPPSNQHENLYLIVTCPFSSSLPSDSNNITALGTLQPLELLDILSNFSIWCSVDDIFGPLRHGLLVYYFTTRPPRVVASLHINIVLQAQHASSNSFLDPT